MIRVVSLFSGCGAADLALYRAAYELGVEIEVVAAIDIWPIAVATYNRNLPHPVARVLDVKTLTRSDLPPHDLIIGGPPCQAHSLAGKQDCRCHLGESPVATCCIADFQRLANGTAWLMENVRPRLNRNGWSERFCAADFGDVTTRKRWFYSSHLLHVIPTPGLRRLRDIRDHEADAKCADRTVDVQRKREIEEARQGRKYGMPPCVDDGFIGSLGASSSWRIQSGSTMVALPGQSKPTGDDEFLATMTSGKGGMSGFMKVAMRGHSASASASAFDDDDFIGSVVSNSWHGNELSRLTSLGPRCRNVSLLEMQRSHSFPEAWEWGDVSKNDRGKMIANSWPIGMGTALTKAMLLTIDRGMQ